MRIPIFVCREGVASLFLDGTLGAACTLFALSWIMLPHVRGYSVLCKGIGTRFTVWKAHDDGLTCYSLAQTAVLCLVVQVGLRR